MAEENTNPLPLTQITSNYVTSEIPPELKLNQVRLSNMYNDVKAKAKYTDDFNTFLADNQGSAFDSFKDNKIALQDYSINPREAYATLSDGTGVPLYDRYIPGANNAEIAAAGQSTTEKWFNGVTKALAKTGTAVLGGTVGTVYGIGKLAEEGSLTALYDNDFSNTLEDWNTYLQYKLPNRYSEQEQAKGLLGQAGTANFWSDKVLGGLSFTAGAIISEGLWAWATGGASLGTSAARWGSEALGFTKVAQGVNKYKSLLKSPLMQAYRAGNVSKNTAIALGKVGDALNTTRFMMTSAGYEASVEALQYKKEARENFYNNFEQLNGRQPNQQEIDNFETDLKNSSNAVFGMNMAVVGSSNLVNFGKIFDLKSPIKTGVGDFIEKKAFGRGITKTIDNTGASVYIPIEATRAQRIARNIFDYSKSPITEGIYEEGGQGTITKVANKWIEHGYNPQLASENIEMSGLIYESLAEQYGTKEGWVENGIGAIIGALGGSTVVSSQRAQQANEIEYKVAGLNTFTEKALTDRLISLNRINGFAQEAEQQKQKGNIVGAKIATDGVLHSHLNHKWQLNQDLNEAVDEVKTALDSMTTQQFRDAGVVTSTDYETAQKEIEDYKSTVITEYSNVSSQFKKNRQYAEYIIGRTPIAGVDEVLVTGDQSTGTNNQEALTQSLTWTLTAGENANVLMSDIRDSIAKEVGAEQTNVLNTLSKLKSQGAAKKGQITKTTNKLKSLTQERDRLQKSLLKVQNTPNETEGDRVRGKELGQINLRLLEVQDNIDKANEELQSFANQVNSQKQYQQGLQGLELPALDILTVDNLTNLKENVNNFKNLIDSFKEVNPQRHEYLLDLLDEYSQAEDIFNTNQATALAISSGNIKLKNINNWLSNQLNKKASLDEFSRDWLVDILRNYQTNKVGALASQVQDSEVIGQEIYTNFQETGEVPKEIIDYLVNKQRTGEELSNREEEVYQARKEEIDNIIKETPLPKVEQSQVQPTLTKLDVLNKRLQDLLKNDYNSLTYIGADYSELMLKKPTKAEIEAYRNNSDPEQIPFLREKLANWRLLDSAVGEDNQSIADLVDLIDQLETQEDVGNTQDEVTEDDLESIITGVSNTTVRYDLAQNTLGSATVQILKDKGIYKLSHIKMQSIANALGVDENSLRVVQISPKGNKVKTDFTNYSPGTVYNIDNTKYTIGAGNTIEIKEADFTTLKDTLNMNIIVPSTKWSYYDIYERVGDQERKRPSDFAENINPSLIYNIKPNDELTFRIADEEYNNKLRDKIINGGEISKELEDEIKNSLKIYLVYKGQAVSTLKSTNSSAAPNENFLLLRDMAKEAFLKNPTNPNFIATVKAKNIFLGSPQINTENFRSANIPIVADKVIATGYIEQGEFKLNREIEDVDKTYTNGTDKTKKVPVVVFKKGAYNVAYPVTLIKKDSPQADSIKAIIANPALTDIEKVKQINQKIIETGIASDKKLIEYNEPQIQQISDEFSQSKTFVSMDLFSSPDYNFTNLANDAVINIDLNNLDKVISDPKLEIDLNSIDISLDAQSDAYSSKSSIESKLSDYTIELATDYAQNSSLKYVDSRGNIVEDTLYTDTFDEGEYILEPKNQLEKIRNVNVLKKAFSEKLPKVVKSALSPQTIQEIEYLLKKYSSFQKQISPNKNQAQEGIEENTCG